MFLMVISEVISVDFGDFGESCYPLYSKYNHSPGVGCWLQSEGGIKNLYQKCLAVVLGRGCK